MKRSTRLGAFVSSLLALTLFVTACGSSNGTGTSEQAASSVAPELQAPAAKYTFQGLDIMAPAGYQLTEQTGETLALRKADPLVKVSIMAIDVSSGSDYDLPKDAPKLYEQLVKNLEKNAFSKESGLSLTNKTEGTYFDAPCVDYTIESEKQDEKKTLGAMRFFLVDKIAYTLEVDTDQNDLGRVKEEWFYSIYRKGEQPSSPLSSGSGTTGTGGESKPADQSQVPDSSQAPDASQAPDTASSTADKKAQPYPELLEKIPADENVSFESDSDYFDKLSVKAVQSPSSEGLSGTFFVIVQNKGDKSVDIKLEAQSDKPTDEDTGEDEIFPVGPGSIHAQMLRFKEPKGKITVKLDIKDSDGTLIDVSGELSAQFKKTDEGGELTVTNNSPYSLSEPYGQCFFFKEGKLTDVVMLFFKGKDDADLKAGGSITVSDLKSQSTNYDPESDACVVLFNASALAKE